MGASFFQRGGAWVIGQMLLMGAVLALGGLFPGENFWRGSGLMGGIIMGIGGLTGLAGVASLRSGLTPFPKPRDQSRLIQTGIYGLMRHPLYTSVIVTAVGWGLFRQSWLALAAAGLLALFFDRKARHEEAYLRGQFAVYREYERRVRRFIPFVY